MTPPPRPYRLGSRGSPLAMVQANLVRDALNAAHGWPDWAVEIVAVKTTGDRVQDRPLAEIGGKALWTKELDHALVSGAIDFAVHSMKDVETIRPDAIAIAAMLPRADVRDRLVGAATLAAIPADGRLGTSSPRRAAQVRRLRPDVSIVPFRGNVDTRLGRLAAGEAEATLLAAAGLERLGRTEGYAIPVDTMLPAPAQGAVGIEARAGDGAVRDALAAIDHAETSRCVRVERSLLAALGADCHSPVAALARIDGGGIVLDAQVLSPDGGVDAQDRIAVGDTHDLAGFVRGLIARAPELGALFSPP